MWTLSVTAFHNNTWRMHVHLYRSLPVYQVHSTHHWSFPWQLDQCPTIPLPQHTHLRRIQLPLHHPQRVLMAALRNHHLMGDLVPNPSQASVRRIAGREMKGGGGDWEASISTFSFFLLGEGYNIIKRFCSWTFKAEAISWCVYCASQSKRCVQRMHRRRLDQAPKV